jgi:hypothetical protein
MSLAAETHMDNISQVEVVASLGKLSEYTHELSSSLTVTLGNLVQSAGEAEAVVQDRVLVAVEAATRSLNAARMLMLDLQHLLGRLAQAEENTSRGARTSR